MEIIPEGLCQCGCGGRTTLARRNDPQKGWVKGKPLRFISNHRQKGDDAPKFNGGRRNSGNYIQILKPGHPLASKRGYVAEHILICEKATGKSFPHGAEPHHVDGNGRNNTNGNLVICQDHAYHMLLHQRKRAYEACGKPTWRKCKFCKVYDDPLNVIVAKDNSVHHESCRQLYRKAHP